MGFTVTTLIGCILKARLMRETLYWLKPSESYWAYRGQLMHGVAAQYGADVDPVSPTKHMSPRARRGSCIAEQRFTMTVETPDGRVIEVTGQPDLVLVKQMKLLDLKTTKSVPRGWRSYVCPETARMISEGPYALRRKFIECPHCRRGRHAIKTAEVVGEPRAKAHHALQLSLYRLLLDRNGIVVTRGELIYQDMETQLRLPVDLIPLDETERYLRERVTLALLWTCHYWSPRPKQNSNRLLDILLKKTQWNFIFHAQLVINTRFDQSIAALSGNVVFTNFHAARLFAQKINERRDLVHFPEQAVQAGSINAMGLIDEIMHLVISLYRQQKNPSLTQDALDWLYGLFGKDEIDAALGEFTDEFPPLAVYNQEISVGDYLNGETDGIPNRQVLLEEMILLWLSNANPAYDPYRELFDDSRLEAETA